MKKNNVRFYRKFAKELISNEEIYKPKSIPCVAIPVTKENIERIHKIMEETNHATGHIVTVYDKEYIIISEYRVWFSKYKDFEKKYESYWK